ncbi:hypothetical protein [Haloplanus aerogenes]|uniref:C2H2-type domain-containing protein n=1 Tax=Haloplanus aerogenes TaxID=660522 RepID=A0A3M0DUY4_9EURY|nr:hypothetical protein [Haloplanus aerogenes]RMB25625.1 hypothetical protein ATH50_0722 [Haloplanus aerogenes]
MNKGEGTGCPLCARAVEGRTELRIHLMVEHRKSTVIDEYVERLGQQVVAP